MQCPTYRARPGEVAKAIAARYGDLAAGVNLYLTYPTDTDCRPPPRPPRAAEVPSSWQLVVDAVTGEAGR